jgi:molybdate transport system substrate-binding protein
MIRRARLALLCFSLCLAPASSAGTEGASLKIYAAASTKDAVETIAKQFQGETGILVEVSPGPSSKLAKQIVEGAPADLFLSADQANADYLERNHLVDRRRKLLGNRLVVAVPSDGEVALSRLADLARDDVKEVALALEKVPAGEYARQALRKAGVWDAIAGKVIGGEDVRATLAFVERGASCGIVYATDTVGDSKVRVALEIDPALHAPIEYPLVLVKREGAGSDATRLYEYLASEKAAPVFRAARFQIIP